MKIGVLLCAFQCEEHLDGVLKPWMEAQINNDIVISSVSVMFSEYADMQFNQDNTATKEKLVSYSGQKQGIKYHYFGVGSQSEAKARNLALEPLKNENCDVIWLLDGDEYYTLEEINKIIGFVKQQKFVNWFGINFKNFVFDGTVWVDGFCPPRIFRTEIGKYYKLDEFYWDNDIHYKSQSGDGLISYKELASFNIPKGFAHIKHLTWLNNEKTKRKVEYQIKHFGHCSYRWNKEKNILEFDPDFHAKHRIPIPKLNT
jgi:hypothetical protein